MKRRTISLLALALCGLSLSTKAQLSVGVSGSYNKNYLYTNISNRAYTQYKPLQGFGVSIPVQYQFNNWLALQVEPGYVQKNYRVERYNFFEGIYQNTTNGYYQLPLIGHFMFGGSKLKGFMNLGGYGAYWASSKVKGSLANMLNEVNNVDYNQNINSYYGLQNPYAYDEKYNFDTRKDRRLELGWLVGAGMSYKVNNLFEVFAEARYYQAITDQQKNYMINQIPRYNQTYCGNLGVLVSVNTILHKNVASTNSSEK